MLNPDDDDDDSLTSSTVLTPDETNDPNVLDDHEPPSNASPRSSLVPWPGSTFIIRSSDRVLTLLGGKVVLKKPGGQGSIHWACVERNGWFGFRNVVSGKFLGYNGDKELCCSADSHREWEQFCIRATPEGGYVFLMTEYAKLLPVGWRAEKDVKVLMEKEVKVLAVKVLAKLPEKRMSEGLVWEFAKVE